MPRWRRTVTLALSKSNVAVTGLVARAFATIGELANLSESACAIEYNTNMNTDLASQYRAPFANRQSQLRARVRYDWLTIHFADGPRGLFLRAHLQRAGSEEDSLESPAAVRQEREEACSHKSKTTVGLSRGQDEWSGLSKATTAHSSLSVSNDLGI